MKTLNKPGYYITESDGLLIYYGKGGNEWHPDYYYYEVYKDLGWGEKWQCIVTTKDDIKMINKTLEFDFIEEL